MADKKYCAVVLMRPGERSSHDVPDAGLKRNDAGDERGENYIGEILKVEKKEGPHNFVYFAPPRVCLETVEAFFRKNKALMTRSRRNKIEITDRLYSTRPEWIRIVERLGGQDMMGRKTLADLKNSGPAEFLREEGERLMLFIKEIAAKIPDDRMALCIIPSPLAETAVLHLWETEEPQFRKPLEELPMLDYLDHFLVIFEEGEYDYTIRRSHSEKIAEKRREDAAMRTIQGLPAPRR